MDEYHATHDWDGDDALSETISRAIAAVSGRSSTEVDQLSTVLDPEAVDALFEPLDGSASRDGDAQLAFTCDDHRVTVSSSGEVTVCQSGDVLRDGVTTEAAFQEALVGLLREAEANGVDIEGGWAGFDGPERPEWGIEIYEVRRTHERVSDPSDE